MEHDKADRLIPCSRCGKDGRNGAGLEIKGPSTGQNWERYVLCPSCLGGLRVWLAHWDPAGSGIELRQGEAEGMAKEKIAQRFARGGRAQ